MSIFYTGCSIIALLTFFVDVFLGLLIGSSVETALYVPVILLWVAIGSGLLSVLSGVLQTAVIEREFSGLAIKRLFYRWIYSYAVAAVLVMNGVNSDCLFTAGFAETDKFIPFLVVAFLVCTVCFALHWLLTRMLCKKVAAQRDAAAARRDEEYRKWRENNPIGYSSPDPEPEEDKEFKKFCEIVDNQ